MLGGVCRRRRNGERLVELPRELSPRVWQGASRGDRGLQLALEAPQDSEQPAGLQSLDAQPCAKRPASRQQSMCFHLYKPPLDVQRRALLLLARPRRVIMKGAFRRSQSNAIPGDGVVAVRSPRRLAIATALTAARLKPFDEPSHGLSLLRGALAEGGQRGHEPLHRIIPSAVGRPGQETAILQDGQKVAAVVATEQVPERHVRVLQTARQAHWDRAHMQPLVEGPHDWRQCCVLDASGPS
mmetsp:Transcript_29884/g.82045  ORF Transcript_29884/g.82045 Transcript_29884/m.82045 type:complete len:241 (-) Transcript_29884:671-1393(-)